MTPDDRKALEARAYLAELKLFMGRRGWGVRTGSAVAQTQSDQSDAGEKTNGYAETD